MLRGEVINLGVAPKTRQKIKSRRRDFHKAILCAPHTRPEGTRPAGALGFHRAGRAMLRVRDATDNTAETGGSGMKRRISPLGGAAAVLGVDGIADFDALHSRQHDEEVQLYAFDILALEGEDLRGLPLSMRKTNLTRLLARRPDGIIVAPFEQGEIGPDLFRAACRMGLEGLVSKRRDRPIRLRGRSTGSRSRTASTRR